MSSVMSNMLEGLLRKTTSEVVEACALKYGFPKDEALRYLGVDEMHIESVKKEKKIECKPSFPLPFNGEHNEMLCQALRQNNGLYTQCQGTKKHGDYCKSCHELSKKSESGMPEYGTMSQRLATGIYDYTDAKGRKPIHYTRIMNKYKLTAEQVEAEASKFNMTIDVQHFTAPEEPKRGRKPSSEPKEPKEAKGSKGRPKKTAKVIELAEDDEDLFASLVASAHVEDDECEDKEAKEQEKAAKKAALEQEKAAKKAALEQEKAAKEQEKAAKKAALEQEKAAKEQEKAALEQEKAAKKAALEQEKEAKKVALEQEKAAKKVALEQEKEAKKAALEQEKAAKKTTKKAPKKEEPEEEETYKKCGEVDGVKYMRSIQTNIVYNFDKYLATEEMHAVGKWENKTIIFDKIAESDSELSDDEVDE